MKNLKITALMLSVAIGMSCVMTPVSVLADETEVPEQTTEATETPETKETEATKATEKAKEPEVTEPSESVSETTETEPSVQNKENEETSPSESAPETAETEPSEETVPETSKETENTEETVPSESESSEPVETEPEGSTPSEDVTEGQKASRKRTNTVLSGSLGGNVTYSFDDTNGTLTISGTGGMLSYFDTPFNDFKDKVTKVVVKDGVTFIGASLFNGLRNLTSVSIPDSVITIDGWAFQDCIGLTEIRLPSNIDLINNGAFSGCTGLKSITIPGSSESRTLPDAFDGCTGLTSVTFLEGVSSIKINFKGCTGIKTVNLPKSVKEINKSFVDSKNITTVNYAGSEADWKKIVFVNNVNPFENLTINYQKELHTITVKKNIDNGTVKLSQYAGYTGDKITITVTPDPGYFYIGFKYEGSSDFHEENTIKIEDKDITLVFCFSGCVTHPIGYTLTNFPWEYEITNNASDGKGTVKCVGLSGTVLPDDPALYSVFGTTVIPATVMFDGVRYKVTAIAPNAFRGIKYIQNITIGANVTVIGNNAFYGCTGLTKVSGGAGVKTIGANAFARCPKLSSFTITSKVLYKIGTYAFAKDSKLKTINIKSTTKLTKKGVKKSLKSSKIKTVKVKKSKVGKYRKYFTKKNCGRKVKVKK